MAACSQRIYKACSIDNYSLNETIGVGAFGKVKVGTHTLTGEKVAIKVLQKDKLDARALEGVAREIHIQKLFRRSRHIIQFYEIIETSRELYIIMEFAKNGELFDYIVKQGRVEERDACRLFHQIVAGVEHIHSMNVVHRDLKPENLLLNENRDIKIGDFGLSNTHQEGQLLQTACGSPNYAAPEMIAGKQYVPCMVDIWSCGVILFALVCGFLPFGDQNVSVLYKKVLSAKFEIPAFLSKDVADLISGMLRLDPTKRLTLAEIQKHVWYRQIPQARIRDREELGDIDEKIVVQLEFYGIPPDYTIKCLESNQHNHVTATYHLLKEKLLRSTRGHAELNADIPSAGMAVIVWANSAKDVKILGSWDSWAKEISLEPDTNSVFQITLLLVPGEYHFKFIVDGVWTTSDDMECTTCSNKNNVLHVPEMVLVPIPLCSVHCSKASTQLASR